MTVALSTDSEAGPSGSVTKSGRSVTSRSGDATPAFITFLVLLSLVPPLLVVPGLGAAGRPASLFGLVLLGWWVSTRFLPQTEPRHAVAIRWALSLYLLSLGASMVAGIHRGLDGLESRSMDRAFLLSLSFAGIVLVLIDGLRERDSVERVLRWAVGLGAVGAVIGIVQFMGFDLVNYIRVPGLVENLTRTGIATRGSSDFARVRGVTRHPIEFGVVLATLLPISVHFASESRRSGFARWATPTLLAVGIPMSISRAGIVALALGMGIYAIGWSWRQRAHYASIAVLGTVAFQTVIPGLLGTIRSLFSNIASDRSTEGRTEDFAATSAFIQERPWLGRGPGTFVTERYRVLDNEYLGTVLERGWVGLASLVFLLASAGLTAIWLVRNTRDDHVRSLSRSLGANIVVAFAVFGLFDALSFPVYSGLLFVLIGCLGALYRLEKSGTS